nr:LysR family substrate-binding domain-containing protein [Lysinibacter cavernae]
MTEAGPDVPEPVLIVAFARGVVPTKWFRLWQQRFPESRLGSFRTDSTDQVAALADGRAGMSIIRFPVDTAGLNVIPLYTEIPVVVAPKDHEISALDSVDVADLDGLPLLPNADALPSWPEASVTLANGEYGPRTIEDVIELVAAGLGLVIVPQSIARLHARKDLIYRPLTAGEETRVGLAWREDDESPEIEDFIGIVRGRTAKSSRGTRAPEEKQPTAPKKRTPPPAKKKPGPRPFGTSRRPGGKKGRRR